MHPTFALFGILAAAAAVTGAAHAADAAAQEKQPSFLGFTIFETQYADVLKKYQACIGDIAETSGGKKVRFLKKNLKKCGFASPDFEPTELIFDDQTGELYSFEFRVKGEKAWRQVLTNAELIRETASLLNDDTRTGGAENDKVMWLSGAGKWFWLNRDEHFFLFSHHKRRAEVLRMFEKDAATLPRLTPYLQFGRTTEAGLATFMKLKGCTPETGYQAKYVCKYPIMNPQMDSGALLFVNGVLWEVTDKARGRLLAEDKKAIFSQDLYRQVLANDYEFNPSRAANGLATIHAHYDDYNATITYDSNVVRQFWFDKRVARLRAEIGLDD